MNMPQKAADVSERMLEDRTLVADMRRKCRHRVRSDVEQNGVTPCFVRVEIRCHIGASFRLEYRRRRLDMATSIVLGS